MTNADEKGLSEKATRELEAQIPLMASIATRQAYERAKSTGQTVVVSRNGFIVAELADGSEHILGVSLPRRKVKVGIPFKLGAGARRAGA
ncbi:hypothetical protein EA797_20635 [Stutzerimonas zhaodongensis]|uniref:Uncharacterized protein n=1 Tax=Stutzerimonas zhaodongensis TaxID=1176257 RepID=A0A3M2HFH1_9GAMM|nr:hypothetical protein [Stutzerimonas zhaodongensis]MCQ4317826.1 hypothetical protein [Stutzerimonas zhaodongensis]RMH87708.1 hypothetical protein EA797_20635 [Stutzerimonas zhaodongensis]